ncbi:MULTISPECIES: hypothetical protein [unclassified Haladaptatus]|uniref:hypothetical protein n=1 Tax=unclassified Haladaptatus TaxID=2622732 RepID=UPI0023E88F24|nr:MULTISPECIES: hypothetical protein [unclassified Haladaptatus]
MAVEFFGNTLEAWLVLVVAAFAGGAFGAAIGALPAFVFTGLMVIVGEGANIIKSELGAAGVASADAINVGITGSIAFGPVFGPHISFAGGAAAAAYAARKGYMDTGFDYFEAKNIAHALGTKPDVLVVGGLFGILGMFIRQFSGAFALPWDPIAMGVVLSAIFHRIVLGFPVIGDVRGRSILDMSPFEREEMRQTAEGGKVVADGGKPIADGGATATRFKVEPWLPHQYEWANVAMIGLVVGLLAAYTAVKTGSFFLAFGISAASLVFLALGIEQIPVTHHIALPASTAALAIVPETVTTVPILPALAIGALFGVSGALTGEVIQRVFYAHSDTHFDPPAAAIVVNSFFIAVLAIVGVLPQAGWVPTLGLL